MRKLIARLMTICLLAVPLAAFAQTSSDVSKDNMKQGTPTTPGTPRGTKSATTNATGTKKHSPTKDNMKPDTTKKSTTKKDATKKDSTKKDDSAPKQ
jgi:pentapeptide MXKDX repeat protein